MICPEVGASLAPISQLFKCIKLVHFPNEDKKLTLALEDALDHGGTLMVLGPTLLGAPLSPLLKGVGLGTNEPFLTYAKFVVSCLPIFLLNKHRRRISGHLGQFQMDLEADWS